MLVDLVRKPFLTDQRNIQKENQEAEKVFRLTRTERRIGVTEDRKRTAETKNKLSSGGRRCKKTKIFGATCGDPLGALRSTYHTEWVGTPAAPEQDSMES